MSQTATCALVSAEKPLNWSTTIVAASVARSPLAKTAATYMRLLAAFTT